MRKAFTLAEILVSLGIIAVLAAVTLPLVNSMKPDPNKDLYLKAYDKLCKCVHQVAMDSSIYPTVYSYGGVRYNTSYYPLFNVDKAIDPAFENYSDESKLPNIMMIVLGGKGDNYKEFVTNDSITWMFEDSEIKLELGQTTGNTTFYTPVIIDVSKDGPNAIYKNANDKKPDQFKFFITATGDVVPADIYGQMYVDTRKQYTRNKKEADLIKSGKYKDLTNSGSSVADATFDIAKIVMSDNTETGGGLDGNPNPPPPEPPTPPEPDKSYWTGTVTCVIQYNDNNADTTGSCHNEFHKCTDLYMYNYTTQITEKDGILKSDVDSKGKNIATIGDIVKRNFNKDYYNKGYECIFVADIK